MNRRVLIVSPHFPPTNAPDHQRVRTGLAFLPAHGWDAEVLAVAPEDVEVPRDDRLLATLPPGVPVHRVRAFSPRWTRRLGVGNVGYRGWFQLRRTGTELLRSGRFDLVFFSTTQFVTTALGPGWRRSFGIPYVVDLQDPWVSDYYRRPGAPPPPGGAKYWFAQRLGQVGERRAWRSADGFISVSPRYFEDLAGRYGWFAGKPNAVIPFGASSADFAFATADTTVQPAFTRQAGFFHIVSVGAVGGIMREALEILFAALAQLRRTDPAAAQRLRFHFIGTSYAPQASSQPSVTPLAARHGVADLVAEHPARIGFFTSLKTLSAADALLLPTSNEPAYSPSRLANYWLAGKPLLALATSASVAADRLRALGIVDLHPPDDPATVTRLAAQLAQPETLTAAHLGHALQFRAQYSAEASTAQLCAFFDRLLASPAEPLSS